MKYTQGTWNLFIQEENGFGITNGESVIAIAGEVDLPENEANGNLIASAPRMYLVLEEILGDIVQLENVNPNELDNHLLWKVLISFRDLADQVLAEAEGK